jgi:hypothetical protein
LYKTNVQHNGMRDEDRNKYSLRIQRVAFVASLEKFQHGGYFDNIWFITILPARVSLTEQVGTVLSKTLHFAQPDDTILTRAYHLGSSYFLAWVVELVEGGAYD